MRTPRRHRTAIFSAAAAACFCFATAGSAAAQSPSNAFDGTWNISLVTTSTCALIGSGRMVVTGGKIAPSKQSTVWDVAGFVDQKGTFRGVVALTTQSAEYVDFTGGFTSATEGSGTFEGRDTPGCRGNWTAKKAGR